MADVEAKNVEVENENEIETTKQDVETPTETKVKPEKTFTQDSVNRMMTREKQQGRASALKELGVDPRDEKEIERLKALIESSKTEMQREVDKKSTQLNAIQEAERRATIAEAKVHAMQLGVQPKFVDDVIILITAKSADKDDFQTIIGEMKIKYPSWFTPEGGGEKKNPEKEAGKKGTGSSLKPDGTNKNDSKGYATRIAAQRVQEGVKSTFWK